MQNSASVMSLSSLLHSVWLLCPCIAVVCGSSLRWYLRWEDHTSSGFSLHTYNIVALLGALSSFDSNFDRLIHLCNSWIREADTLHTSSVCFLTEQRESLEKNKAITDRAHHQKTTWEQHTIVTEKILHKTHSVLLFILSSTTMEVNRWCTLTDRKIYSIWKYCKWSSVGEVCGFVLPLEILFHDLHFFLPFLAFPVLWSIFVHIKRLQSEKAQIIKVHSQVSYCLPQQTLLMHCLKHLVWSLAITSVCFVCHYVTGVIQVYILINLSLVVWWENTSHVGQDTSLSFIKCLYISCTVSSSSSWLQYSLETTFRETTVMV